MVFKRASAWLKEVWDTLFLPPGNPDVPQIELGEQLSVEPGSLSPSPTLAVDANKMLAGGYSAWRDLALTFFTGQAPSGVHVPTSLGLPRLRIRTLPAGLSVAGNLDLRQCQRLRRIGDGLVVGGNLQIGGRCSDGLQWRRELVNDNGRDPDFIAFKKLSRDHQCPLERLPEGLTVDGNLHLRSCYRLQQLPAKYRLGGDVLVESCRCFRRLPDPFAVTGNLTLKGCRRLQELPESLCVGGDLRLIGLPVTRLPERLVVDGSLILENCAALTELPSGLTVFRDLIVRRCSIAALPEKLKVGRNLLVDRCNEITDMPTDLRVGQDICLRRCARIRSLPAHLKLQGSLRITQSAEFCDLPEGLGVPGVLSLAGCSHMETLPSGLRVGYKHDQQMFAPVLTLSDCTSLTALPEDLRVNGPIDVAGSGLTGLPKPLESRVQLLWRGMAVRPAVVFHPETLQPAEILGERNTELRRIMLERVGLDVVLSKSGATVLNEDTDPGGPRLLLEIKVGLQRHHYLHCRCPSTGRQYLLRVPPHISDCRSAAAWLAGFNNPNEYRPIQET
ncbi:MAG: hypothetical protein GXX96_25055 [Planctomycetaceae bacterium]|nr:hypothetical protein [Planctomycetaceae bacterium]